MNPPTRVHTDPSDKGLRLYLKFFFITERDFMLAYVHVEEEEVTEMMRRARGPRGRGRSRQEEPGGQESGEFGVASYGDGIFSSSSSRER